MRNRGYTLVEMLISIGLVALLLVVIVESAMTIARSHDRARDYIEVNSAAMGAFSRFSRDIRRATGVDAVNSTLGASEGKLVLLMKKEDGSNDVTTFALAEERVRESFNGAVVGDLTPSGISISNLTFNLFTVASTSAVRIEMTVAPNASSTVPAVNFYGTYVLRGSYTE